jgi:alpha-tubulin suppressor-like RCC1 family protein
MPVQVSGLTSGVQIIAAGGDTTERAYGGDGHTCAIVNGGAWCWGSNMSGEIGNNSIVSESHVPDEVFGLASDVRAIAAGSKHTCAIVHDGVQCWGWNSDGQLGNDWADMCYWPVAVLGL